jgi:hypothetical protein
VAAIEEDARLARMGVSFSSFDRLVALVKRLRVGPTAPEPSLQESHG